MRSKDAPQVKTANITAWAVLVFLQSLQVIILVATIYSFIPIPLSEYAKTIMPLYWDQIRPEREMPFYIVFILFNLIGQAGAVFFMRKQLAEEGFARRLLPFTIVEAAWVFLQVVWIFKIFVFGRPDWAKWALYITIGLALLNKIFWPEARRWALNFYAWAADPANSRLKMRAFDVGMPLLIVVLLCPVSLEKVLGQMFVWDNFFHMDFFVMSPGWAWLNGLPINTEVNSNYNVLIPAVFASLARITGGFDYMHMLRVIIGAVLVYYVLVYFFLRQWFKSAVLPAFGVLLAIKLQMFHWGVFPIVWRFPSATPARTFVDIAVIFLVYKHAFTGRLKFLWAASAATGVMAAYVIDAGVYMTTAFYAYLAMRLLMPETRPALWTGPKDARRLLGLGLLPWLTAFVLLWVIDGQSIWQGEFWSNMTEYSRLFLNGFGTLPVQDVLKDKQFFAFCMGFVIPAVYVWTLIYIGALCFLRQMPPAGSFIIFLCVYGLGLFHYFVYRSGLNSYYAVCIPFVFLVCFWARRLGRFLPARLRQGAQWLLCAATLIALVSSYLFTVYPNALNLARADYGQAVAFMRQQAVPAADISLIQKLTTRDERVPLISSYETSILLQADRKPFFYYFPLVYSGPFNLADFKGTDLLTVERMRKTLLQLEQNKPAHVFIEAKLYGGLPAAYYEHYQTLKILIRYLNQHYASQDKGRYLLALKRKD